MERNISKITFLIIIILTTSFIALRKNNELKTSDIGVEEKFDLKEFINSDSYRWLGQIPDLNKKGIIVIYVINSSSCSVCLNEIYDYVDFFKHKCSRELAIQQFIVVSDNNKVNRTQFINVADFPISVAFGFDEHFQNIFFNFGSEIDERQLIYYNISLVSG